MIENYTLCKCGGEAELKVSSIEANIYTAIYVCEKCSCSVKNVYYYELLRTEYLDKN